LWQDGEYFFAIKEKEEEEREGATRLLSIIILLYLPMKFSMKTSEGILPSVIKLKNNDMSKFFVTKFSHYFFTTDS